MLSDALRVSALVATVATVIAMMLGAPLAYLLARRDFAGKRVLSAVLVVPLVLPPTAVGYLLLRLFADRGLLGRAQLGFDLDILLTWKAAALASTVMAWPLVIRTARVAFESVSPRLEAMARTLGYGPFETFFRFTLPLARRGLIAAAILGFMRSIGEFGATIIVAGSIPGKTQTLASAIYNAQQVGNDVEADKLIVVALGLGLLAIVAAEFLLEPRVATKGRTGGG